MLSAKISAKGQVTLPKKVRQALNVERGERVLFVVSDQTVVLQAMGPSSAEALAGSLTRYAKLGKPVGEARGIVKREVARAAAREG